MSYHDTKGGSRMKTYQATVTLKTNAHSVRLNDLEGARALFQQKALEDNPNGTQGEPRVVQSELSVGHSLSVTFEVDLVEPIKAGDGGYEIHESRKRGSK